MLSRKEKILMDYIFGKCSSKDSVLISPDELMNQLRPKYELSEAEVKELVDNLVLESYITMILSDKKGKPIYCISLDKKGESYERDKQNSKKATINLIIRTILLAVLSTLVGVVIKLIF